MKKEWALSKFDSQSELARQLGISNQAVNQWGEDIPLLREYQINAMLDCKHLEEFDNHYVHPRRGHGVMKPHWFRGKWWEIWKWL